MQQNTSVSKDPIALTSAMAEVLYRADAFARAATPVVLYGESGTGKTFLAEYIHRLSGRSGGFHPFSVGTVAPQLAADELFGHVRGAYTDARSPRTGLLASAGCGTLLLDNLHTLDLGVQKQLLQVLDRGTFSPVGSDRILTVACRVIMAMTEDPDVLMRQGLLLKDLRYRFAACGIRIPPLRERRAEIPSLAQRALERLPGLTRVSGPTRFSRSALRALSDGSWEGNVRELEGAVLEAFLLAAHEGARKIGPAHMPDKVAPLLPYTRHGDRAGNRIAVERALKRTGGNVKRAATLLGVSRTVVHGVLTSRAAIR
jgi:DNA-binding NtrC family response regulator